MSLKAEWVGINLTPASNAFVMLQVFSHRANEVFEFAGWEKIGHMVKPSVSITQWALFIYTSKQSIQ